jgi:hypothetical protein
LDRGGSERAADLWAPATVLGFKPVQTEYINSNTFKFISKLIHSKKGIFKLKKYEIKYGF